MQTEEPKEDNQLHEIYQRNNSSQINKVRCYVRTSQYLLDPFNKKEHMSIDKKLKMSEDLINFPSIAIDNTTTYIKSKLKGETVKLIPVFVTETEEQEHCSLYNKTIAEIKSLIQDLISDNFDDEKAKLQTEIFMKTVKIKKKEKHIEFLFNLYEQLETSATQLEEDDVTF